MTDSESRQERGFFRLVGYDPGIAEARAETGTDVPPGTRRRNGRGRWQGLTTGGTTDPTRWCRPSSYPSYRSRPVGPSALPVEGSPRADGTR